MSLFVCGEAPGPNECERGSPFVGRSGDWLNAGLGNDRGSQPVRFWPALQKPPECDGCPLREKGCSFVPGFGDPRRVFVSNVRRCLADDETPEEKAASTAHCVKAFLAPELARVKPRSLLLIGGDALAAITGLRDVGKYHGSVWHRAEIDEVRRTLGIVAPLIPDSLHTITATLHPAFAMRAGLPQLKPSIIATIARAMRWSERPAGPRRDWTFILEPTPDDVAAYLGDAKDRVAVDVETLHDDHSTITMIGFSARDGEALVTPWTHEARGVVAEFLARRDVLKVFHNGPFDRTALAGRYGIEVAQPIRDTINRAALLHPPFKQAEKHRWLNLPTCTLRLIDGMFNWKDPERPEVKAMYRAAWPHVPEWLHSRLYNAVDNIMTRLLDGAQEQALTMEGMKRLHDEIVAPAAEVLYRMERRGMPLDEHRRADLVTRTEVVRDSLRVKIAAAASAFHQTRLAKISAGAERIAAERQAAIDALPVCMDHPTNRGLRALGKSKCAECEQLYAMHALDRERIKAISTRYTRARSLLRQLGPDFNSGSPDHWRAWLFSVEGLGLIPLDKTPITQKPSIDDKIIEALQKRYPDCEPLRWRVGLAHALNRLSGPLAVEADEHGRVHFAYAQHRTPWGQTTSGADDYEEDKSRDSGAGNAQNITDVLRQIFAAESGRVILHGDYSQIESRIMAWKARAKWMTEAFIRGEDVHSLNAARIYGCAPDQARKHRLQFGGKTVSARTAVKPLTHGWNYLKGDFSTSREHGITISEARRGRLAYFASAPEIPRYQEEVVRRVNSDRVLVNSFGRRLRFYGFIYKDGRWQTTDATAAMAFIIASDAKDIAKAVLPGLDAAALTFGAELLTHTHDSFTLQVGHDRVGDLMRAATEILVRPWPQLGEWPEVTPSLFSCPVDWAVGANWGERHEHDDACDPECDRLNPDGLVKVAA